MNLIKQLKNITAYLIHLVTIALIHSLSQQFKKLLGILNTNTGELTPATRPQFPCKFSKKYKYRQPLLLTQSLLILSSFVLIISCAPSSDTTVPPDNPTLLANLIKESTPSISGLSIATDNSDPANPKLTITGITNSVNGAPATATITIDQSKGITTDPTSFIVTADNLISPYNTNTALTVTFEGEAAVSYTVTTQISGAAVSDWIVTEKLSDYITVSFGGQPSTLSVTDTTLSIEGLTNIDGDAGTITFTNLPAGFTAEPSSITLPNPTGTESATITANPNIFTITENGNTGNSETYTIADIDLAKLTRFTPSTHIKITESGSTDKIMGLMITEEGNTIRIVGLTNKLGDNQYTLTIDEVPDLFTIPGVNNKITITIAEPTVDFLPAPASAITPFNTIEVLNSGESTPTTYTLIVDFSAAAPSDWFTMTSFATYITGGSYNGKTATLTFDGTTLALSGGDDFTNVPNGEIILTQGTTPLLTGYALTTNLMDPDGAGLAAVDAGSAGMITIFETAKPMNRQDYPVTITLGAYKSPLTADNITAMYGGASPSDITIDTNMIVISGFTNNAGTLETGTVMVTAPDGYTITPTDLPISDPTGENSTNEEIGTITITDSTGLAVPHSVTVNFLGMLQLSIVGNEIMNSPLTVNSRDTIPITTAACELLSPPTMVTVVGESGSKVAETTPFPLYYDRGRDSPVMANDGTLTGYTVTRNLILEASDGSSLSTNFPITVQFPACTTFAVGTGNDANNAYVIDNAPRLELASYLVNTDNGNYGNKYYKITADINMGLPGLPLSEAGSGTTGKGFVPIGIERGAGLSGTLDCANHTITNLYINRPEDDYTGLVGVAEGGMISNCRMTDVNITGRDRIGGLVGNGRSSSGTPSTISNSYVTGTVSGRDTVGGLVGELRGSMITHSYATATVSGRGILGGLVGTQVSSSTITHSYATGTVSGNNDVGGLVGRNNGSSITDSYATGTVSGERAVGGLVGLNNSSINNSYATGSVTGTSSVGGLVGISSSGTVTVSYWNTGTSGQSTSAAGTGRTTLQMQVAAPVTTPADVAVYVGWDAGIWNFTTGKYPRLKNVVCANRQDDSAATDCTSTLQ
ncbi:hypothetical protein COTS27_00760 [Spirochaetota bacterium]|nr:hypothetical protein COTS27_00760 [Spirochaetota bacterium]